MKTRTLLALLPLALAAHFSPAFAVPTTSLPVGNSTLFVSGPVLGNLLAPAAIGSDISRDHAATPPWVFPVYIEEVILDPVEYVFAGPDVAPPVIGNDVVANPLAVPEPSAMLLVGLGLLGLSLSLRRR